MQLAIVAAGFTPGEADGLRRAMAAWKRRGGLEPYRRTAVAGMARNGYPPEFAEAIFRQILGFGEYGFPESHAAAFALLAYVSAWLKCHEPAAFAAALINSQPMGFYAPAQIMQDARRSGVAVLPVDVTRSAGIARSNRLPRAARGRRCVSDCGWCAGCRRPMARASWPRGASGPSRGSMNSPPRAADGPRDAGARRGRRAGRVEPASAQAKWHVTGVEGCRGLIGGLYGLAEGSAAAAPTDRRPGGARRLPPSRAHDSAAHPLRAAASGTGRRGFQSSRRLKQLADGSSVRGGGLVTTRSSPTVQAWCSDAGG